MYTFIDHIDDLEVLNNELNTKNLIGVDTEFRRTSKDNMKLALLQVNDGEEIFIIDAIAILDPQDKASFLFSNKVLKIFHSCKEDIEAIYAWTGKKMENLFDTQIAEAILGGEYSIGYQALVKDRLGIDLDKSETRSNWIRRPLTDSQLRYATYDVEYLNVLYSSQEIELSFSNKGRWLEEELNLITAKALNKDDEISYPRSLTRAEEDFLLNQLNNIVIKIAQEESINPTFLFSKKNQKDFIRHLYSEGQIAAYSNLTEWRQILMHDPLSKIISM